MAGRAPFLALLQLCLLGCGLLLIAGCPLGSGAPVPASVVCGCLSFQAGQVQATLLCTGLLLPQLPFL